MHGFGRAADARKSYQAAYDEMAQHGLDAGLWEAEAGLAATAKGVGSSDEASRWIRSAAAQIRAIAAGLAELELADRFLAQPHIQAILGNSPGAAPPG